MKIEVAGGYGQGMALTCSNCGDEIDWCQFCDDPDCPLALCYGCVHLALGEVIRQPHAHGG